MPEVSPSRTPAPRAPAYPGAWGTRGSWAAPPGLPASSAASRGRFCPGRSNEEKEVGIICMEEDIFKKMKTKQ